MRSFLSRHYPPIALAVLVVASAAMLAPPLPPAVAKDQPIPTGRDVIVRHKRTVDAALVAALKPAFGRRLLPVTVGIIVDATPYTAAAEDDLVHALLVLGDRFPQTLTWRVARLGEPFGRRTVEAERLAPDLRRVLDEETIAANTMAALRATVRSFGEEGGIIVYLADWRFEDDDDIEGLIRLLRARQARLSVVGSEAAFQRGWNDGFFPPFRGDRDAGGKSRLYDEHIGRDPFGSRDPAAPWHGGDTAYPHLPTHYGSRWSTKFRAPRDPGRRDRYGRVVNAIRNEDLRERLRSIVESAGNAYSFTLPSGFGPYGLMRVARETGGRYVLWSWNSAGRTDIEYDFGKIDLLAPDLRPRRVILRDIRRRPLARALLDAWHTVATDEVFVTWTTPPVAADLRTPLEMQEYSSEGFLDFSWRGPGEHREFLKDAAARVVATTAALRTLDRALKRTPAVVDDIDRRLRADALLFRHALASARFTAKEANAVARRLPADAWKRRPLRPGMIVKAWIHSGSDPDDIRVDPAVELRHPELGAALLAERESLLRRYGGTPQGEQIARNSCYVHELHWWLERSGGGVNRETPAESKSDPKPPSAPVTPGGSGSSSGPSTGGR